MTAADTYGPGLHLHPQDLLSKWGFNDGDEPDALLDIFDDLGVGYPADWHDALRTLVRDRLVPALEQRVEVEDIETIHNPIRARSVDGTEVDIDVIYGDTSGPTLSPEAVVVPWPDVLRACGIEAP